MLLFMKPQCACVVRVSVVAFVFAYVYVCHLLTLESFQQIVVIKVGLSQKCIVAELGFYLLVWAATVSQFTMCMHFAHIIRSVCLRAYQCDCSCATHTNVHDHVHKNKLLYIMLHVHIGILQYTRDTYLAPTYMAKTS